MAARTEVTPNRRGVRSRELVLDAAERVMAEHGFEAATLARVVAEAGIPMSSVYHYFGSKDGILLAVMERGADRFFAGLPDLTRRPGRPAQHLARVVSAVVGTLQRHPDFLRLLIVFAAQPPPRAGERSRRSSAGSAGTRWSSCGPRSRPRSATIRRARSLTGSRGSRWPPSTARSSPSRPTTGPRSNGCSNRSRPRSTRPAGPCWPEAEQATRCPWPAAVSSAGPAGKPPLIRRKDCPGTAACLVGLPLPRMTDGPGRPHASQRHPG